MFTVELQNKLSELNDTLWIKTVDRLIENDKIVVKTSAAAGIHLLSEGRYAPCRFSRTETFCEAVFDYVPAKFGRFFRIEVRDARGFRAFSNAYYPEELAISE